MIYENTPQLETERLILRKLTDTPDDMNAMFAILRDQETNTFLPWFPAKDMTDARRHAKERYFDLYTAPSAYRYVICLKSDNIPDRPAALPTMSQFTSPMVIAVVPIIATAVCAVVLTARTAAARSHFFILPLI